MSVDVRLGKLRQRIAEEELDAVLVSTPENRRYMSGFSGSAGYLVVSEAAAVLATDFRYVEQAGRQAPAFKVERIAASPAWLPKLASELGVRRMAFESRNMTVATHSGFERAIHEAGDSERVELVPTTGMIEKLRTLKAPEELELLTRAVEIADEAFEEVAPTVEPGVTEEQVAWRLEQSMRGRGAESVSFDIIVGSGPNGALPHHRAGERTIGSGDAVVIDMGATYRGYCSDLSRTVIVGEPDETFRSVYDTVLRAQLAVEEKVVAGMTGGEADTIARDIIAEAGYGDNFGHSLGHGVGLAVHELPVVGPKSQDVLEEGMVFTVEPGIYLSGWGGVRIEDMVVLENGRARVISGAHKRERVA